MSVPSTLGVGTDGDAAVVHRPRPQSGTPKGGHPDGVTALERCYELNL